MSYNSFGFRGSLLHKDAWFLINQWVTYWLYLYICTNREHGHAYKYNEPYRHKFDPIKYRVTNWREYNRALRERGNITIWLEEKSIRKWYANRSHKQGAQRIYSNTAIEVIGIIRLVFHLPLRQTEGFMQSVVKLMKINLLIPDFSTVSRRMKKLKVKIQSHAFKGGTHIIIDSSGLSVYGADEWHETKKGTTKFRGYRKLNIAINEHQEIVACELTDKHANDQAQVPKLLRQVKSYYDTFIADGNYDDRNVYAAIEKNKHYMCVGNKNTTQCSIVIPPRCDARARKIKTRLYPKQRSDHIRYRAEHGRINWQKATGYGERSLVEVAFYRYKRIFGEWMRAINFENQRVEASLVCKALNIITNLGMPQTERVN